jgi:hypothetical protein
MRVRLVEMRKAGVAVPRRMLSDRFTIVRRGSLVILDVTDQGLRRQVKVARLMDVLGGMRELVDPHIIWANEDRFTLAGFERSKNERGESVDYAQSWLCTLDYSSAPADELEGPARKAKPQR